MSQRVALLGLILLLLSGCGREGSPLPLQIGHLWTYESTSGLVNRMVEIKVTGGAPAGNLSGWRLSSDLGDSVVAQWGGVLYAAELSGTRFDPPVPLARSSGSDKAQTWKGTVTMGGATYPDCEATLTSTATKEKVGASERAAVQSTLTVRIGEQTHMLDTWVVPKIGMIRQEHRIGSNLAMRLRYVSGP